MTLDELQQAIGKAFDNAHLLFAVHDSFKRVKSVSVRIDEDQTISIILHGDLMPNRVESYEAMEVQKAKELIKKFQDEDAWKDFSGVDHFRDAFYPVSDLAELLDWDGERDLSDELTELVSRSVELDKVEDDLAVAKRRVKALEKELQKAKKDQLVPAVADGDAGFPDMKKS